MHFRPQSWRAIALASLLFLPALPVLAGTPVLKAVGKNGNPGKATVKLIVETVWEDNSGYHLLLDPSATMYDDYYILGLNNHIEEIYEAATVRMPEDADMTYQDFVAENSSDSILVDPGIYDMLIINVTPGLSTVYDGDGYSHVDDMEFVAGLTYVFNVSLGERGDRHTTTYVPPVEMELSRLVLPATGCELDSLTLGIGLRNNGGDSIAGLNVGYTIEGSGDTIRETVGFAVRAGQDTLYHFSGKLPLETGRQSVVQAWITPATGEAKTYDNYASGLLMRHEPLALPHRFHMESDMLPGDVDTYVISGDTASNFVTNVPLVSSCFTMEEGFWYRLSYEYVAGSEMLEAPSSYQILLGSTSQPLSEWKAVKTESDAYSLDFIADEVLLNAPASGTYAFCFLPLENSISMGFRNVRIDTLPAVDLRIGNFQTDLPQAIPVSQTQNRIFHASATVSNRGYADADSARIRIMAGERLLHEEYVRIAFDTEAVLEWELGIKEPLPLSTQGLSAIIEPIAGQDADESDNLSIRELRVNDSLLAYDRMPDDPDSYWDYYSVGSESEIEFGLPFFLSSPDTLTAISVGWTKEEEKDIRLLVYPWNDSLQTIGAPLFDRAFAKGPDRGQVAYEVDNLALEAGAYMFAVRMTGFGLAADMEEGGVLYVTSYDPVMRQTDLGFPSIRAIFGTVQENIPDVAALVFTRPADSGHFSAQETVSARIENKNASPASFTVVLDVNGKTSQQEVSLDAQEQKEISFTADLSEPGTYYNLLFYTALENDADRSNDTIRKQVFCLPDAGNEDEAVAAGLRLYPNPVSGTLYLSSQESEILQLVLTDMQGRVVFDSRPIRQREFQCEVSGFDPGLYFARIKTAKGTTSLKFIVR